MGNKFKLDVVKANYLKSKSTLIRKIADESTSFFQKSFRQGGFTDASFVAWQARKNSKSTKPILVKSGRLRRSIRTRINSNTSATLVNDVPYAQIHNEGGTIQQNARSRIISFTNVGGKSAFAKTKTASQRKKVTHQSRSTFKAGTITMPKRKFMGKSRTLDKRITKLIGKELDTVFKT